MQRLTPRIFQYPNFMGTLLRFSNGSFVFDILTLAISKVLMGKAGTVRITCGLGRRRAVVQKVNAHACSQFFECCNNNYYGEIIYKCVKRAFQ